MSAILQCKSGRNQPRHFGLYPEQTRLADRQTGKKNINAIFVIANTSSSRNRGFFLLILQTLLFYFMYIDIVYGRLRYFPSMIKYEIKFVIEFRSLLCNPPWYFSIVYPVVIYQLCGNIEF